MTYFLFFPQNGDYLDSSIYLGSNSSYSASKNDGVFMEGASEGDDDSSSISSHQEEKDNKKDDKPPVELMLDFQVIILPDLLKLLVISRVFCLQWTVQKTEI